MKSTVTHQNPFPGLRPFRPDESHLFFGRRQQIEELTACLERSNLLAVIGSSGSGKSSLVRCGLLAALEERYQTRHIVTFRPENSPIHNLCTALQAQFNFPTATEKTLEAIASEPSAFLDALEKIYPTSNPTSPLIIFIDQFEEIFRFDRATNRQMEAQAETKTFIELLLFLKQQKKYPLYIIFTIRSDFLGYCAQYNGFAEAINKGQYLVPKMTPQSFREVILEPIAYAKARITPNLTNRLLEELGDNPDQLPILQHALMRTWDYWAAQNTPDLPISEEHYEAIGRMEYALSQHADEAFQELETPEQQRICELLFKAITDKGTDSKGVRRPTALKNICLIAQASLEEVATVVDVFRKGGRSFLMPSAEVQLNENTIIDIAHESLIRIWTKLMMWADEESHAAETYISLAKAAALYQENRSGLWRDPELQLALSWFEKNQPNADWANRYDPSFERAIVFLEYSRQQRDFELEQNEKRQQERFRRTRMLAGVMSLLSILAIIATLFALINQTKAEKNEEAAKLNAEKAKQKTIEAQRSSRIAKQESQIARQAKDEALSKQRTVEEQNKKLSEKEKQIKEQLNQLLQQKKELENNRTKLEKAYDGLLESTKEEERQRALADLKALEANAERLKAINASILAIQQKTTADSLRSLNEAVAMAIRAGQWWDEGFRDTAINTVVKAYNLYTKHNGTPENPFLFNTLYKIADSDPTATKDIFTSHQVPVRAVATTQSWVASGDESGEIWIRKSTTSGGDNSSYRLTKLKERVRSLCFTPIGDLLLIGTVSGKVFLWDFKAGNDRKHFRQLVDEKEGIVHSLEAFVKDEKTYVAYATPRHLFLGTLNKQKFTQIGGLGIKGITAMSVSKENPKLALAAANGIYLFEPDFYSKNILKILEKRDTIAIKNATALALTPNGKRLWVGYADGRLRSLMARRNPSMDDDKKVHRSKISKIVFDEKGEQAASASLDGQIKLWNVEYFIERDEVTLQKHRSWVWDLAYQGWRLYSVSDDKRVIRWRTRSEDLKNVVKNLKTTD